MLVSISIPDRVSNQVIYQLTKYNSLLRFNKAILFVSIGVDFLTIGLMFLPNDFVYAQWQSLALLIKVSTFFLVYVFVHSSC